MAACLAAALTFCAAAPTYEAALKRAASLYNEAEWDAALRELSIAEALAATDAQRVDVWMQQGIMLANVPDPDAARAVWKRGLAVNLKAELPLAVSPRVRALFQDVQREVKQAAAKAAPPPVPPDAPKKKQALVPDEQPPDAPAPFLPPQQPEAHFPVVPLASLGAGVVAGGVGLGFALGANSELEAVRRATTADEKDALRSKAQTESTVANVAFAVAGAAALTALITFIVLD